MPRIKDQAICIRFMDWSESSQIVTLLCQEHGKLSGLAKGSKRTSPSSTARYSGGFELMTMGQVVAVVKPTTDLATLTEWDLQQPYWHLRQHLRAQQLGFYAADLARAFLADHDPHPQTFAALADLLANLANADHREMAILWYQWRLLADCGFRPQLEYDVRTGKPLVSISTPQSKSRPTLHATDHEIAYHLFDPQSGGLTIRSTEAEEGCWRIRDATVQLLHQLSVCSLDQNDPMRDIDPHTSSETIDRANQLLCVYARSILDRQLPTMRIILDPHPTSP